MRIHQLSPHVANQIAAGEVIERPASVVKELLENAVDANAKAIHVDIRFGGLNLIKVSDNGSGIIKDDLILAVAPHATSKISQLEDLYCIDSMGFRGEALASIASVSRLNLSSKPANQKDAMMLQIDEDGMRQLPCARHQGTTVEVIDLFYNVPVRKKFLKSERLEFQAIEMVVKRFGLSAPEIALNFKHNGKEIFSLPPANGEQIERLRIKKLLGKTFFDQAIYIETEYESIKLRGWLSSPAYQRSQRDKQWIYLNRRMIQDRLVQHAVQQAYQMILHPGRFASCLIYLTIPATQVDVNVHPTKHEVRFQEPRMIHDFMVSSISQALEKFLLSSQKELKEKNITENSLSQHSLPYFRGEDEHEKSYLEKVKEHVDLTPHVKSSEAAVLFQKVQPAFYNLHESAHAMPIQAEKSSQLSFSLGRLNSWYVINAEFVLVMRDIHTVYLVHALRAYQALCRNRLMAFEDALPHRPLLVPLNFSIQKKNHVFFEQLQVYFQTFGIHFDFLTPTNLLIRSIPQCLPQLNLTQLFTEIERKNLIDDDVLLEMIIAALTFNVYACQEDEKLELLHFIQQQDFPGQFCKHLDQEFCLGMMSDA